MSTETSKCCTGEEEEYKENTSYGNTICDGGHGDVGYKEEEESSGGEGTILVGIGLTKVKELLDGCIGIGEDETGNFIVVGGTVTAVGNEGFNQFFLLVGPILDIGGYFGTMVPDEWHEEGYNGYAHGYAKYFDESSKFGVIDSFHSPYG